MNQTDEDRMRRLGEGRCPVHGVSMPQTSRSWCVIGGHYEHPTDAEKAACAAHPWCFYWVRVSCPRRDCEVEAWARTHDGPWWMSEEAWNSLPAGYPSGP